MDTEQLAEYLKDNLSISINIETENKLNYNEESYQSTKITVQLSLNYEIISEDVGYIE